MLHVVGKPVGPSAHRCVVLGRASRAPPSARTLASTRRAIRAKNREPVPAHRLPMATPCVYRTEGWIPRWAIPQGASPSCLPVLSSSVPSRRSAGHMPRHQGLGVRSVDSWVGGTPSPLATHGTWAEAALPLLPYAALWNGPVVSCAQLSAHRSLPAPHWRHSSTWAALAFGSTLALLGRSLARVPRSTLSTLSVRSSLSERVPGQRLLSRGTARPPFLASLVPVSLSWIFSRALKPPVAAHCPSFLRATAELHTFSLHPHCGPHGLPPQVAHG